MTGRELIRKIVESCLDLDDEVFVFLLHRDTNNWVENRDRANSFSFINGKIYVEANSL